MNRLCKWFGHVRSKGYPIEWWVCERCGEEIAKPGQKQPDHKGRMTGNGSGNFC